MHSPVAARVSLALMSLGAAWIGLPASMVPRGFYDSFPFIVSWVEKLPPYNEHLVTDVGGLYLALAVIAGWAAWTLERSLVHALAAGWLVAASLHWLYHVSHLSGFGTFDAIAQMTSLTLYVGLPLIALWAARPRST